MPPARPESDEIENSAEADRRAPGRLLAGFWEKAGGWALPTDARGEGYAVVLRGHPAELGFCALLVLASGLGQTFLLSIFQPHWMQVTGLSPGEMGTLYGGATLLSGLLLPWAGRWLDRVTARTAATVTLVGLAVFAGLAAGVTEVWMLAIAVFGLRFFGQGVSSNAGITWTVRWFDRNRGKALSLVGLGYPTGEAFLPTVVTLAIAGLGWRGAWGGLAGLAVLGFLPLAWWLLGRVRPDDPRGRQDVESGTAQPLGRRAIARDWRFYAMLGLMSPLPFVTTGLVFFQTLLALDRGWSVATFPTGFLLFAGARALFSLSAGSWVDRLGAVRLIYVPAFTFAAGLACLLHPSLVGAYAFFGLLGISYGASGAIGTGAWVEMFGRENIGLIRGLSSSVAVFTTAAAPWVFGLALDAGVGFDRLIFACSATVIAVAWPLSVALRRGRRRA